MTASSGGEEPRPWWWTAVIYEVYPRSFADGNGDGEGDLAGLLARLPYLADLGVDGLWIAPWYPSPLADGGYDVSDYRDVHPMFGTLADADRLIAAAHAVGLRVVVDVVPNHTSAEHPWFVAAQDPEALERARYFFRPGRDDGPPNNWISAFGGSAWTRTAAGDWYLHTFAEEQPDLDWSDPALLEEFDDVLRFWFERGVDGLRIDAAPALAKRGGLPDADYAGGDEFRVTEWTDNPHWDVPEVHGLLRRWRAVGDEYGDRVFVAEAVVADADRLARYLRADEMHTAFNFPFLKAPWEAGALRAVIDDTVSTFGSIGVPPTWVLASHDEVRLVTRYGRATTSAGHIVDGQGEPVDLELGRRRARAAVLLLLALPGGAYLYQGEELGLPNVDDLPDEVLQDPIFARTDGAVRGRDGARVPLPWSGDAPPYGFSPTAARTWLPQPGNWGALTVESQTADPASMLQLHRAALRLRRELVRTAGTAFDWLPAAEGVLAFDRGGSFRCVANLGSAPVALPEGAEVLIASTRVTDGLLPVDGAAWIAPAPS